MPTFSDDFIKTEMHPDGIRHKLLASFHYQTDVSPAAYEYMSTDLRLDTLGRVWIDIPAGFVTDFTSSPRIFWALVPPVGRDNRAALVRDFLYCRHPAGRRWSDAVYAEALKASKIGLFGRILRCGSARLFGRHDWDADAADEKGY